MFAVVISVKVSVMLSIFRKTPLYITFRLLTYPYRLASFDFLILKFYKIVALCNYSRSFQTDTYTGCPKKEVSIKNFQSELLTTSIHSF